MISIEARVEKGDLVQRLEKKQDNARKAIKSTISDLKRRAPGQVADAVTEVYDIKRTAITPGGKKGMAGRSKVSAGGDTIASFSLTYTGNPLSPYNFGQTPEAAPGGGRSYGIKATIMKGSQRQIGHWSKPYSEGGSHARPAPSPFFLPAGVKVPFMRQKNGKWKVFRTVSIPQMVGDDEVATIAVKNIQELAEKRLKHNLERFLN